MPKRALAIPSSIRLPFGYKVKVCQVPYAEILILGSEDPCYWDSAAQVLYIDQDLSLPEKRYFVASQLFHICLDFQHDILQSGLAKPNA